MNPLLYQLAENKIELLGKQVLRTARGLYVIEEPQCLSPCPACLVPVTGKELLELAEATDKEDFKRRLLELSVSDLRVA